jgi:hypothetical protein
MIGCLLGCERVSERVRECVGVGVRVGVCEDGCGCVGVLLLSLCEGAHTQEIVCIHARVYTCTVWACVCVCVYVCMCMYDCVSVSVLNVFKEPTRTVCLRQMTGEAITSDTRNLRI